MTDKEALEYLRSRDREITLINHTSAVLGWDYETILPPKAVEERCEQLGTLSALAHRMSTEEKLREAVATLKDAALPDADRALVRSYEKFYRTEGNLPESFVEELSVVAGQAHTAWLEAREKNDYSLFIPTLSRIVELSREEASITAPEKKCYDALLDKYEDGITMEVLDGVFSDLEEYLHSLMDRIGDKQNDDSFLRADYEEAALHSFCTELVRQMGFDFSRGIIGLTAHPFTTTLGRDDIRISTRYSDPAITDPISSIVHECGHALYEMNAALNPQIRGTSLSDGASLGLHESQSRFWENMMGKSLDFWRFSYPALQKAVPSLEAVPLEAFWKGLNKVQPSAIRVNADEVTYSLHIILRYRIEKAIFEEKVPIEELPELWNSLSEKILRYRPLSDTEGILQDCHWSQASFGYFPTYALGNLYGAMFRNTLIGELGGEEQLNEALRSGSWDVITEWQKRNIWQYGCIYEPSVLLERVTGRPLVATDFKQYLEDKYSVIYSL